MLSVSYRKLYNTNVIMFAFLIICILSALASAFALSLLIKLGVIGAMQLYGNDTIAKLANCAFCLSFWVNVIVAIIITVVLQNQYLLLIPVCSTALTKYLIFE